MPHELIRSRDGAFEQRRISTATKGKTFPEALFIAIAVGFVAFRAIETPPSWLEFGRLAFSLGTIALVCFAPYQSLLKRAVTVVAVEACAGIVMFAFVDVPAVMHHRAQIVTFAVSLQDSVAQFERSTSSRR